MAHAIPKFRLRDLDLEWFGFVDDGDNPGAHLTLSKARRDKDGDSPMAEEHKKRDLNFLAKLKKRWVIRKMEPRTTRQLLDQRSFDEEFWKLRWAYQDSVWSILEMSPGDEMMKLMASTTKEFVEEAKALSDDMEKSHPEEREELVSILDELEDAVKEVSPDSREHFAKAVEKLQKFDPPNVELKEGDAVKNAKKSALEEAVKNLPADQAKAILDAAKKDAPDDDGPGEADPAPGAAPDPAPASKGVLDPTVKAALEAMEKRVVAAEKSAADSEAETRKLRNEATAKARVEKARSWGIAGVDDDDIGLLIAVCDGDIEPSEKSAEALERFAKAMAAQTSKGARILKQVGSAGGADTEKSARKEAAEAVAELMKAAPGVTEAQAYADVYEGNPDLQERVEDEIEDEELEALHDAA